MRKGDIFQNKPKLNHPIIFLTIDDYDVITALALTKCKKPKIDTEITNIVFDQNYMKFQNPNDARTQSFVMSKFLLKKSDWLIGATKIGELTKEGINYINDLNLGDPVWFDDELQRIISGK